jgi:hypothetical protein
MRLRLRRAELLGQIIALVSFDDPPLTSNSSPSMARRTTDQNGARGATRPADYRKRREDPSDPKIWGDLVQFSDEEPIAVLHQLGIPRERKEQDGEPDMAEIQDRAMDVFDVTQKEFFEQNRRPAVALCRIVSMALCRAHTSRTADEIGEAHGRDHAAVSRAVKRVKALRGRNPEFERRVAQIEAELSPMAMAA